MIAYLMKTYALSEKGAYDLIKGSCACALSYMVLMLPAGLLYLLAKQMLAPYLGIEFSLSWMIYVAAIVVILLCIVASQYLQYGYTFLTGYEESAVRRLSFAEKLRTLPLSYFGKKDISDLTTALMADSQKLETAFTHWIPELVGAIFAIAFMSMGLFFINTSMAIAALWCVPLSFLLMFISRKVQIRNETRCMQARLNYSEGVQECLEALVDLRSYNATDAYIKQLDGKVDYLTKITTVAEFTMASFVVSAQLVLRLGLVSVVVCGSMLLYTGELDVLTFFMFLLVASRIYDPLSGTLQNLAAIYLCEPSIQRLREVNEYKTMQGRSTVHIPNADICFDKVHFAYNKEEPVVQGCSFVAKQGEVTALIGPSGSGKTSLAKLAARFWDIDSGTITLGGEDISTIDPETLLRSYSIVFQDVTLFNTSIKENIRIGNMQASDEDIMRVAKQANCDGFALACEQGYDTIIGENGHKLSGGERQRISIARAMLKDAPVILLDESTASLDVENETAIQQALSRLIQHKTVIIIAHRMRTVQGADKIVVLQEGKIVEQGSPESLYKQQGYYYTMLKKQQGTPKVSQT